MLSSASGLRSSVKYCIMAPMSKPGRICRQSGWYRPTCSCRREMAVVSGERFPRACQSCYRVVNWNLTKIRDWGDLSPETRDIANWSFPPLA